MIQVVSIHINTDQSEAMSAFYQKLLGAEPAWSSADVTGFMVGDFRLEIARHDQVSAKNRDASRLFFDLMVTDVRAEFQRSMALGATAVQQPYEFADDDMKMVIATLADPDGNYFQLVSMEQG